MFNPFCQNFPITNIPLSHEQIYVFLSGAIRPFPAPCHTRFPCLDFQFFKIPEPADRSFCARALHGSKFACPTLNFFSGGEPFPLSIKTVEKAPLDRIPYGSDVLCFIGENPGCEKSQPGFFYTKKRATRNESDGPAYIQFLISSVGSHFIFTKSAVS